MPTVLHRAARILTLAAALASAALLLTGCTLGLAPRSMTCALETEFVGYFRDPGPHRHYPAMCDGQLVELEEFKPGADAAQSTQYEDWAEWAALWTSDCVSAEAGTRVRLTPAGAGTWYCEVVR